VLTRCDRPAGGRYVQTMTRQPPHFRFHLQPQGELTLFQQALNYPSPGPSRRCGLSARPACDAADDTQ
jgi:hypothetical protein